jgi:hypothetical protein
MNASKASSAAMTNENDALARAKRGKNWNESNSLKLIKAY